MKKILICYLLLSLIQVQSATLKGTIELVEKQGKNIDDKSNIVIYLSPQIELSKNHEFYNNLEKMKSKKSFVMSSSEKKFDPELLTISVDSIVNFTNEDIILHNAFSLSKTKNFDLGLFEKNDKKEVKFDKTGIVKVYCNVHELMNGYILVFDHPYYTQTNETGEYEIENIPDGNYDVVVWHRFGGNTTKTQKFIGSETINLDFKIIENKIRTQSQHLNKWGKPYKGKY